jgi:quercetin dioxygenase-like cupin family protein
MNRQLVSGRKRRGLMVVALSLAISANLRHDRRAGDTEHRLATTILTKSLLDEIDINAHTSRRRSAGKAQDEDRRMSYVVDNKIAPSGTTGWHSHPGPSLILVVAGTVTNYRGDDPSAPHVYSRGSGFIDEGGTDVHAAERGQRLAETIAVQLLPKDAARRTDMPAPGTARSGNPRAEGGPGASAGSPSGLRRLRSGNSMGTRVPRARADDVRDTGRRACAAAEAMSREGTAVRHIRTAFVPDDETCFHFFEATSEAAVVEACERAGIGAIRIVPVVE